MQYTQFGQILENIFYFTKSGPWSSSDLVTLAASVVTEWTSNVRPNQSNDMTLDLVEATDVSVAGGAQITQPVGVVGGNASVGITSSITLAIKFASGFSGRSHRGRMYLVGIPVGAVVFDQVAALYAAGIVAAYATFFGNINATTTSLHSIASYCNAGAWRTTGVTTPVTNYLVTDLNIDSQRRRLAGRGI